jgi:hypothetical protein
VPAMALARRTGPVSRMSVAGLRSPRIPSQTEVVVSPYLTRREAADYLRTSVDTIDRMLVPMGAEAVSGRLRFRRLDGVRAARGVAVVRVVRSDVLALLPLPEGEDWGRDLDSAEGGDA